MIPLPLVSAVKLLLFSYLNQHPIDKVANFLIEESKRPKLSGKKGLPSHDMMVTTRAAVVKLYQEQARRKENSNSHPGENTQVKCESVRRLTASAFTDQ